MRRCTRTKGARVRPTNQAYGDVDPGRVCPTATAAAVMLQQTRCCCRCRTSVQVSTVVVAPVTKKKLFLLDKTCERQIFRPQIFIVLNFNQKQH